MRALHKGVFAPSLSMRNHYFVSQVTSILMSVILNIQYKNAKNQYFVVAMAMALEQRLRSPLCAWRGASVSEYHDRLMLVAQGVRLVRREPQRAQVYCAARPRGVPEDVHNLWVIRAPTVVQS